MLIERDVPIGRPSALDTMRPRAAERTCVHHSEVTEREVVLDRIARIEAPERRRDVLGHTPAGARVAREAEAPAYANYVRVERDDQL